MVINVGLLDSFLGDEGKNRGKKEEKQMQQPAEEIRTARNPFSISMKFIPRRLSAMRKGKIDLEITVKNNTNEDQLVSVDALLPRKEMLGFDPTCVNKHMEKRLGNLAPGEDKNFAITVWSSNQTKDGEYPMELTFYSHYLDYKKVLNYVKRDRIVRVI